MKRKKKMNKELFAVKAARKASREEEIRLHGKPVSYRKVEESKKVYNRRKNKAGADEALPYLYLYNCVFVRDAIYCASTSDYQILTRLSLATNNLLASVTPNASYHA